MAEQPSSRVLDRCTLYKIDVFMLYSGVGPYDASIVLPTLSVIILARVLLLKVILTPELESFGLWAPSCSGRILDFCCLIVDEYSRING